MWFLGCGFCQYQVSSVGAGVLKWIEHAFLFYLSGMMNILSMGPVQETTEQQLAWDAQLRMMESGHCLATKASVFSLGSAGCARLVNSIGFGAWPLQETYGVALCSQMCGEAAGLIHSTAVGSFLGFLIMSTDKSYQTRN